MSQTTEPQVQWSQDKMVEVRLNEPDDFPCPEYSNLKKFNLFFLQNFCIAIGLDPIILDIKP